MEKFIADFEQATFKGALELAVVATVLVVGLFVFWFRKRSDAQSDEGTDYFANDVPAGGASDGVNTDVNAGDADGEEEEEPNSVRDISHSNDDGLELCEGEVALLIFFFDNSNELCDEQWSAFNKLSLARQDIGFVSVDTLDPATAPIAAFHDVHHVPSFVFRREGEVAYHRLVGLLDERQLEQFITYGLNTAPQLPAGLDLLARVAFGE